MRYSLTTASLAAISLAISAMPASAQYRHSAMQPPMDETRILSQGTAVQVPLIMLADSKRSIVKANVEDKDGHNVGSVNSVVTDQAGRASAVKINVGGVWGVGKKIVALDARAFLFEQDRNLLIANLTQDEIKALPGANGT
jgi:hypothetical protein